MDLDTMVKYKVGYTTGVYDLFHIGHLNILRRAKELCEYLIVGISTDELVMEYKNKKPVIPFEERKQIVEAIKYVDQVVAQETLDKVEAYSTLRDNLLLQGNDCKRSPKYEENLNKYAVFVGSDWKGTPKWNKYEHDFKLIGVDVVYFPYTEGTSSTKLSLVLDKILS